MKHVLQWPFLTPNHIFGAQYTDTGGDAIGLRFCWGIFNI